MTDNTATPTVSDRSTEFVAVTGGEESSSAGGLLVTAYIIMWAIVFAFVWLSARRVAGLEKRLTSVEQGLKTADDAASR